MTWPKEPELQGNELSSQKKKVMRVKLQIHCIVYIYIICLQLFNFCLFFPGDIAVLLATCA